ncbi:MAG: iron ABC transporter permease [Thermococcus sp.]|uniref:Iron ABC transporter n=1 Tax=Thermococcus guaymasensis DSM 11113 TaxID=1432656 RepID=A0A0X1KK60_9EURY|nr:iron ABC transporter permease [Thermococcus guaymasensis]AJC71659.1 iron ABC transporter [Thermococcus guaymasensis DSM 11113]MCD6523982.1 iron ABC transporter permease [Thermococcus sp.]
MRKLLPILLALSVVVMFLGVYVGSVELSPSDVTDSIVYGIKRALLGESPAEKPKYFIIIWEFRLPRVLLAYLVGLSLASAGVASQALFKNPMADPYIIGISGGASIGAALGLIYFPNHVSLLSFAFAILSVYVVYTVAKVDGRIPVDTLLLSGVAFGFMANAVTSYLVLTLGPRAHLTYMWLMGSFNGADWEKVRNVFLASLFGLSFLIWKWKELNVLLLGEEGVALGLDVDTFRKFVVVVIAIMSAVSVASAGIIGFVGLIGPHIARILVGPNHKRLTLNAALIGGILMVLADLLARTISRPTEIPVGIVTAMMGGPFFLYLLRKHKRGEVLT